MELLIVLALVGMVAAAAVISFVSSDREKNLQAASSAVAECLRYARSAALAEGAAKRVDIDTALETIQLFEAVNGAPVSHPSSRRNYLLDLKAAPFNGVDIVSVSGATGIVSRTFAVDGSLSSAAILALRSGSYTQSVLVNQTTGRISVQAP